MTVTDSHRAASACDEIDGLRQYWVIRVDRLGDEDEPHGQRTVPATAASTSTRRSPASCAGVECQSP